MRTHSIRRVQKLRGAKPRRRARGQAVVEMAIVSMVLIFFTMGLIQYGLIYNTLNTLENITRDTARFAGVHGAEASITLGTTVYPAPDDAITAYAATVAKGTSVLPADITVIVADSAGNTNSDSPLSSKRTGGQPITVTIKYPMYKKIFDWGLPGMGRFRSPSLVPTTVTMIIEGQ